MPEIPSISVSDIITEINAPTSTFKKELNNVLVNRTYTDSQFMTSVMVGDGGTYIEGTAIMDDVVQGFKDEFEPIGTLTIKPNEVRVFKQKVDLIIKPNDLVGKWASYLRQENLKPSQQPITTFWINQVLKLKVLQNRQKLAAKGAYDDTKLNQFGFSLNGYNTMITADLASSTGSMFRVPIAAGAPTDSNIVDFIEQFVDGLPMEIDENSGFIFVDPKLLRKYLRKDRALHGVDPTYKAEDLKVFGTGFTLQPLMGLQGTNRVFYTPKANFLKVSGMNDGISNLDIQPFDRYVKVMADWQEGYGFGYNEAVFVAVPNGTSAGLPGGRTSLYYPDFQ